eukprot:CAMPEP_0201582604 /NCGR_PEP_ID=MMETSP0190_2-20130828/87528_1 /ASSEMBLY_ACC=CAM_ASM_000263 /TAXON_ID=37353 /ORGANISM="Rosalina sp." /LENGTH=257 /DNA_ID=CAMNT_0048022819 /DNA_START=37 /DNA_END=811 /DNA_ORIENTATION=+
MASSLSPTSVASTSPISLSMDNKDESDDITNVPNTQMDDRPGFYHSKSAAVGYHQKGSLKEQLYDMRIKFDALEQKAKILELEKEEFSKEITKLHQENEELKTKCQSLTTNHNDFFHTKASMANVLGSKSVALDQSHIVIEKLKQQLTASKQRVQELESENNDLTTKNNQYEQRLEELNYKLSQKDDIMESERELHDKRIEELSQEIEQLQEKLHTLPDESKYHEPNTPSQSDHEEMQKKLERPRLASFQKSKDWIR